MEASKIDYDIGIFYLLAKSIEERNSKLCLEVFEPPAATDIK